MASSPELHEQRFYRPKEIESLLGRRCVDILRQNGLRAVGGWYLGQTVLDSFRRACEGKFRQRVPEERKVTFETEHAEQEEVGQNHDPERLQSLREHHGSKSLSSQVEAIRGLLEAASPRAKSQGRPRVDSRRSRGLESREGAGRDQPGGRFHNGARGDQSA